MMETEKTNVVAWPKGFKKTKQREQVLSILENADVPVTAMDIYARIEKKGSPVWLSTVYRILDLLAEKKLVIKTNLPGSNMAFYELNRHGRGHMHHALCVSCHKIISMENCPLEGFEPKLKERNFHVTGHKMELYGYCDDCYLRSV